MISQRGEIVSVLATTKRAYPSSRLSDDMWYMPKVGLRDQEKDVLMGLGCFLHSALVAEGYGAIRVFVGGTRGSGW